MSTTAEVTYRSDQDVIAAEEQARTIVDEARELQVIDEVGNSKALDLLTDCRKAVKKIDALKKRWLDPLNAQVKFIRGDFDDMAAPAKEADCILSQKTSAYRMRVQEAARKEQARLNAIAERRQAKAAERAEAKGEDAPPILPIVPTIVGPAKTVATEGGKVSFRKQTHFEVIDARLVPLDYFTLDEKKIGAAVRAGIATPEKPIPGVRIWVTEEPVVR